VAWKPGQRKVARALEDPYDGVPPHLRQPLFAWVENGLLDNFGSLSESRLDEVAVHLRLDLGSTPERQLHSIVARINANPTFLLDMAEALLELYGFDRGRAQGLSNLLNAVNSAYEVGDSCDGLEERIAPGVKQTVTTAVAAASGSAGDHLANAWNEAYGRKPDPVKAYSESVKAVEAALAHRVSPQNGKQTLGTMIRDVAAKPSKWTFVIGDDSANGLETLLGMMRLLWNGQTSRHGGTGLTRDETPEEARAAVHLAATLVQFGVSGAFSTA
jgi:hypothetical protein